MQNHPLTAILAGFDLIAKPLLFPMLLVSRDGRILSVNAAAELLLGRKEPELDGRLLSDVANASSSVEALLSDTLDSGGFMLGRLSWQTADGASVSSSAELYLLRDDSDTAYVMLRVLPDGSETGYAQHLNQRIQELSSELAQGRRNQQALRESQERFHRAQQAARLGTWDWDLVSGTLVWDGVEAVHGREPGSFDQTFESYVRDIHPADKAAVLEAIQKAVTSGEDLELEYRIILPNGDLRWVSGLGRSFRNEEGKVIRMSGTCQDITQRKRAEEQLAFLARASEILASSLRYEETLDSLARLAVPLLADWCALYVVDQDTIHRVCVVHSDPAKEELANYYKENFPVDPNADHGPGQVIRTGQSSWMFQGPPPFPEPKSDQAKVQLELGMRSIIIVPMVARNRTIGAISLGMGDSGRIYDERDLWLAEEVGRRAGLAVDNAMLFEESQRVQAELRRSNEAKDEFLGILAHEIRSPTTTIYGTTRVMRSRWKTLDEETIDELLEGMEQQADRLNRLIQNLLVIARMELGHGIPREETDVTSLVERTVGDYLKRRPSRAITTDLALVPPASVVPTYVEQVVRNLIENADKYSPADQPIAISLRQEHDGFTVRVRDRGPGINPDEINLIFESFYRSSQTSAQASGKGLGLTVCKRLIEAQDGRIWARNRPGGGLEVGFWLPLSEPEKPAAESRQASQV